MLLDQTDLQISTLPAGSNKLKSLLLHIHLSSARTHSPYTDSIALVDSGCTAAAFADLDTIVTKHAIPTRKLIAPRPLRLADGAVSSWITDYFTACMTINQHTEVMLFYVTSLSPRTPVILGLPWLQQHEPYISWSSLQLRFTSPFCSRYCLQRTPRAGSHSDQNEDARAGSRSDHNEDMRSDQNEAVHLEARSDRNEMDHSSPAAPALTLTPRQPPPKAEYQAYVEDTNDEGEPQELGNKRQVRFGSEVTVQPFHSHEAPIQMKLNPNLTAFPIRGPS